MGVETGIAWTDHTFNPWWGCQRVSPGCVHCYAEAWAKRTGFDVWGPTTERRFFGEKHWREPVAWNAAAQKAGVRKRVFCASMADVFEDRPDLVDERVRLAILIGETPHLDWQLLTKRPENAARLWDTATSIACSKALLAGKRGVTDAIVASGGWMSNVWLGTTVEDQKRADERIPHLLATPARVRFLSCEPLLEAIDLGPSSTLRPGNTWAECLCDEIDPSDIPCATCSVRGPLEAERRVDWVIVGGESGGGARPFDTAWARSIVAQCKAAGVPAFVKQLGAFPISPPCEVVDIDRVHPSVVNLVRLRLRDSHGGDMDEWAEDLRVREFPRSAVT